MWNYNKTDLFFNLFIVVVFVVLITILLTSCTLCVVCVWCVCACVRTCVSYEQAKAMADIGDASSDTDMNGLPKQIECNQQFYHVCMHMHL